MQYKNKIYGGTDMTFAVFADGTANLPSFLLEGIRLLPCEITADGHPVVYNGDIESFDTHAYYDRLRKGADIKTSLLNTALFTAAFEPLLKEGTDVVYIAMSAGISGTYNAAVLASQQLTEEYPERFVHIVDSQGCGFGSGMLAVEAAQLSRENIPVREAAKQLDDMVPHCCQYFTVDDLNFLKRTGRVSGATAMIGTALNIKPILYGDSTGHIVSCAKCHGRKKSIQHLAEMYREKRMDLPSQNIYISHGDCPEDAEKLKSLILEITPESNVIVCPHEPFSGAHVGPGMLGLFFLGRER